MKSWHRFYDPVTGRYISPDPIGLEGGLNLYAYVGGNPVNWSDPEGLAGWAIDTGGAYGTGWGGRSNSSSGMAGTGVYIGVYPSDNPADNHAEIGGFTYTGSGETTGADIGLGFTLTRYKTEAKNFFEGPLDYKKITLLGGSYLEYYDECGNKVGWSIGIGGKGLGFSNTKGKVFGFQGVLQ